MHSIPLGQYCLLMNPDQGLSYLDIQHPDFSAQLYLQGAHLTQFRPSKQQPWLWLSDDSPLQANKAIRGGIPICWPWFGRTQPGFPAHGIARISEWHLDSYHEQSDSVQIELHLNYSPKTNSDWPYPCRAQLRFQLSKELRIELISENTGNMPMPLSLAMHSYFACQQLDNLIIFGLENCTSVEQGQRLSPSGHCQSINPGMDRVYFEHSGQLRVEGLANGRLELQSTAMPSVVLWNPGPQTAATMKDLSGDGSDFFCAENGLIMDDEIMLSPGEQHQCQVVMRFV